MKKTFIFLLSSLLFCASLFSQTIEEEAIEKICLVESQVFAELDYDAYTAYYVQSADDQLVLNNANGSLSIVEQSSHKVVTVSLRSILMGECGSDRHCHHEPVGGVVYIQFYHQQAGQLPSMLGGSKVWQSNGHSLVCNNLNGPVNGNIPINDYRIGYNQFAYWYDGFLSGVYSFRVLFNLGVEHRDNPFASVGGHWLAQGSSVVEVDVPFNSEIMRAAGKTLGPFRTQSDRCHEFWLHLSFSSTE